MPSHEELDEILRDVAEECIPEVRASDEYKELWAKHDTYLDMLKATMTEAQWYIFAEYEDQCDYSALLEEIASFRKIFFYGLAQGIKIGRRSKNGRAKRASNI
jgi:hypothetical protein